MKSTTIFALSAALAAKALALTPITENFDGTTLDPLRWYQTPTGKGRLAPADGRLSFVTASSPTKDDFAVIELLNSQPGFNENWELVLDLTNSTSLGYDAACGMMLFNVQDRKDYLYLDFYGKGAIENKKRINGGIWAGIIVDGVHDSKRTVSKNPGVSKGAIRIRFNKNTKLLTLHVSPTQKDEGYSWIPVGSFSPTGKGGDVRANWKMNAGSGRFGVQLFGMGVAKTIKPNKVALDNFSIATP